MAGENRRTPSEDADWIFASDDPHTLPTEQLPDRAAFDRYAAPLIAKRDKDREAARAEMARAAAERAEAAAPTGAASTGATPVGAAPVGSAAAGPGSPDTLERPVGSAALPERTPSYARSGTTPNAEDDGHLPAHGIPARFQDLGVFDALRDVLALICLATALTTTFTVGTVNWLDTSGKVAIGIGLLALLVVHLLRWIPANPPLAVVRIVRVIGLLPALLVAVTVVLADLVTSLPLLFASLPDGPPVGIGVGVPLLLLGAIVGIEPRAHEGYLPHDTARNRARMVVLGIGAAAAAALLLALVMIVGRLFTTGWGFSLKAFADALISALLLAFVFSSVVRRERSWFVFSIAAVGGLVVGALADNTLRLQFAAPISFATGFVYLPALFAAFGLMISRSHVRTIPMSFERADWLVYAVRAFEFSVVMHTAAALWHLLAAIASPTGVTPGGPILHLMDAAVCACFVAVSLFARRALLHRPPEVARASGVIAGIVLVVVGFLDIIVNSLATGAGTGLLTGGVALVIGIAAPLMLTVPAPVRDEFGAPDLAKMFTDFRRRDAGRSSLLDLVPDVSAERARRKNFPHT